MCVLKTTGTIIHIKYIQKRLKNIFCFDCGNLIEVQRKSVSGMAFWCRLKRWKDSLNQRVMDPRAECRRQHKGALCGFSANKWLNKVVASSLGLN